MAKAIYFAFSRELSSTPAMDALFDKSKMAAIQIRVIS